MEERNEIPVKIKIDQTELDEVMWKVDRIKDLVEEINSLVEDIASKDITLGLQFER